MTIMAPRRQNNAAFGVSFTSWMTFPAVQRVGVEMPREHLEAGEGFRDLSEALHLPPARGMLALATAPSQRPASIAGSTAATWSTA